MTISTVGTAGAGGTGVTFTPALAAAHAAGSVRDGERRPEHLDRRAERHRAERDAGADRRIAGSRVRDAGPDPARGGRRCSRRTRSTISCRRSQPTRARRALQRTSRSSTTSTRSRAAVTSWTSFQRRAQCRRRSATCPRVNGGSSWTSPTTRRLHAVGRGARAATGTGNGSPDLGLYASSVHPGSRARTRSRLLHLRARRDGERARRVDVRCRSTGSQIGRCVMTRRFIRELVNARGRHTVNRGSLRTSRRAVLVLAAFGDGRARHELRRGRGLADGVDPRADRPVRRRGSDTTRARRSRRSPRRRTRSRRVRSRRCRRSSRTEQVGRVYDGGASDIGYEISVNGGQIWNHGELPLTVQGGQANTCGGPLTRASDTVTAYDARYDVWLVSVLGLSGNANVPAVYINRGTVDFSTRRHRLGAADLPAPHPGLGRLAGQELDHVRQLADEQGLRQLLRRVRQQRERQPRAHPGTRPTAA